MVAATRRPQWLAEATSEAPGVNLPQLPNDLDTLDRTVQRQLTVKKPGR
jgi:hypothetical protein